MERLTKREGKHTVRIGNEWRRHDRVWDRLAKYEDLEEQCIKETTWSLKELLYKWKVFYESIAELYNYRKLEEQGLLLRLPCKLGDVLEWVDALGEKRTDTVNCMYIEQGLDDIQIETLCCQIGANDIGKTLFLTNEEAEAALEKMRGE